MPHTPVRTDEQMVQHESVEEANLRARDAAVTTVEAVVTALIPEFELVEIETSDGQSLSITRKTEGVTWQSLREGQRLSCQVRGVLTPRVVSASILDK